jgi:mevalonate kinase
VLVTGAREALGKTLLAALYKSVSGMRSKGPVPHVLEQIETLQGRLDGAEVNSTDLLHVVTGASEYAARSGKYTGTRTIYV